MKLYSWCWFDVVFSEVIRKKENKCQDARNWQPGEIVQLLCGMAVPKGAGRQDGHMYGEVSLETAAHLTSAPWGERLPEECLSEPFHGSPTQGLGEGCSSCLSLQIWISQLTNFTIIKQMSWVYICAWWLCIHLYVYRSICVCVYGYAYLFPSLFTLVG